MIPVAIIERWAIRKKGTNLFIPGRPSYKGFSFDEPTEPAGAYPIRTFEKEIDALRALRAWCKGEFVGYAGHIRSPGHPSNTLASLSLIALAKTKEGGPMFENKTNRKFHEMEVVPVTITISV